MNEFWVLGEPDSADARRRSAKWNGKNQYESIRCRINPGHRRAGARISPLNVLIRNVEPYDFVWAPFECLVQEHVLQFFKDHRFAGFEVLSATVRFAGTSRQPPAFWEFVATGSAGLISPESGYSVLGICPDCGVVDDKSRISDPTKVIDRSKWDGSDFFRIEPISGLIFVTDRVVQALDKSALKGWRAYSLSEMKDDFDIMIPEPSTRGRSEMN